MFKRLKKCVLKFYLFITNKDYIVNNKTKEIHDIKNQHVNCHIELMTDKVHITEKEMLKKMEDGFNGCRWCLKKYNNG